MKTISVTTEEATATNNLISSPEENVKNNHELTANTATESVIKENPKALSKNIQYKNYDDNMKYHHIIITFLNIAKGANASIFLNSHNNIIWSEGPNRSQFKGISIFSKKQKTLMFKSFTLNTKELHIEALENITDLYINLFVATTPDLEVMQGTIILPPNGNVTIESNFDSSSLIEMGSFSISLHPR